MLFFSLTSPDLKKYTSLLTVTHEISAELYKT